MGMSNLGGAKRMAAGFLAALMILSLTACGGGSSGPADETQQDVSAQRTELASISGSIGRKEAEAFLATICV